MVTASATASGLVSRLRVGISRLEQVDPLALAQTVSGTENHSTLRPGLAEGVVVGHDLIEERGSAAQSVSAGSALQRVEV